MEVAAFREARRQQILTGGPRRLARRLRGKKKDKLMAMQRQLAAAAQWQGKKPGG
jgi:hypothetical protein